jgi:hypothetical protein
MQAIRSDSLSVSPDFSPNALAHNRQILLFCEHIDAFPLFPALFFVIANSGSGVQHHFYNALMPESQSLSSLDPSIYHKIFLVAVTFVISNVGGKHAI